MHKGISTLAVIAVLVQGPAAAGAPGGARLEQRRTGQNQTGLCRTPLALPQLGPERWNRPQPGPVPMAVPRGGDKDDRPASMAAPMDPPPPPPVMARDSSEGTVTAARKEGSRSAKPTPVPVEREVARSVMPPRDRPDLQFQGGLTAGEHDDLLNPELYADYVRRSDLGQQIAGLPQLDTRRVLTIAVNDRSGQPLARSMVEVQCADGNRIMLPTQSDGTVVLFPALDQLGSSVMVRAAGQDWRSVIIAPGAGGQRVTFTLDLMAMQMPPKLDLMLVIDTTGSMGDEIQYLQNELAGIVGALRAQHPGLDLRVGFVFYRDVQDSYVTHTVPFTRDISAAQGELVQQGANGGGDYPEAMEQALIRAAGQDWRADAVKTMLLVADAPPHDADVALAWHAGEVLRAKRVQVVPVAASGVGDSAEYLMRGLAALTQSRYTFLTDDSGIGNPHAAPAIDCYLVTRLDALLRRVIDSQLSGRRVEPERQEVIRRVGQYDNGRCVIPRGRLPQE